VRRRAGEGEAGGVQVTAADLAQLGLHPLTPLPLTLEECSDLVERVRAAMAHEGAHSFDARQKSLATRRLDHLCGVCMRRGHFARAALVTLHQHFACDGCGVRMPHPLVQIRDTRDALRPRVRGEAPSQVRARDGGGATMTAQSALRIAPITVKAARAWVRAHHRHLPDVQGGLFASAVVDDASTLRGVAVAGNPARVWQGQAKLVISRCATDECPNACSALYGSLCRAAKALGYREAWTYTLPDEPGTSLRAAGFVDQGVTAGGEHDRPSRHRRAAVRPEPKRRWLRILNGGATP
jgi:hypothetical protein